MKIEWTCLGLIFIIIGLQAMHSSDLSSRREQSEWSVGNPGRLYLDDEIYRLFFAGDQRSHGEINNFLASITQDQINFLNSLAPGIRSPVRKKMSDEEWHVYLSLPSVIRKQFRPYVWVEAQPY